MRIPQAAAKGWCTAGGEEGPMGTPPVKRAEMIQQLKMRTGTGARATARDAKFSPAPVASHALRLYCV